MVQSATPANVDTVLVDGRIVKRHGRLVAYDVEKVVRDAKASSLRIRSAAGGVLDAGFAVERGTIAECRNSPRRTIAIFLCADTARGTGSEAGARTQDNNYSS